MSNFGEKSESMIKTVQRKGKEKKREIWVGNQSVPVILQRIMIIHLEVEMQ